MPSGIEISTTTATTDGQSTLGGVASRAATPLSSEPRPFLRWAGSKRGLVRHLLPHLPASYNRYFEPFLGSGAMFFLLQPSTAVLNDACNDLIRVYEAVAASPGHVIATAQSLSVDESTYYAVRSHRSRDEYTWAGEFIYLNHTCFNGLYRVNLRGEFNVPWGRPKTDHVVSASNVEACAELLNRETVTLQSGDFAEAVTSANEGDFVFLDPPYVTSHNNNGFIAYNEKIFSWDDQIRLARCAADLAERGCHVIVTNANHADVLALYPGFEVASLDRASTIAGSSAKRGRTSEVILTKRGSHA